MTLPRALPSSISSRSAAADSLRAWASLRLSVPRVAGSAAAVSPPPTFSTITPAAARAVKEKYAALKAKADYEQQIAHLIPREDVDAAMRHLGAAVRSAMDVFPDQTAPLVAPVSNMDEVHSLLSEACRSVLAGIDDALARQQAALASGSGQGA